MDRKKVKNPVLLGPGSQVPTSQFPSGSSPVFRNTMTSSCAGCRWAFRGTGSTCRCQQRCPYAAKSWPVTKKADDFRTLIRHGIINI